MIHLVSVNSSQLRVRLDFTIYRCAVLESYYKHCLGVITKCVGFCKYNFRKISILNVCDPIKQARLYILYLYNFDDDGYAVNVICLTQLGIMA